MDGLRLLTDETSMLSSPYMIRATPAYKRIKGYGRAALPKLFEALRKGSRIEVPILMLLADITGERVDSAAGDIRELKKAWLAREQELVG